MTYISMDDLTVFIQQQLIDQSITTSIPGDVSILDNIEKSVIDLVISYLAGKYDYTLIFATPPIRNGVLVQIISSIVIYRAIRRNAARKVPDDLSDTYKDAIKMLEKIQNGVIFLVTCPLLVNTDGSTMPFFFGNNTNTDFFI
jgi:phage gp36-like protein